ncbi:MAG: hypothetical protein ThorAB25_26210 [Candidatus Thorarchaeota archaeon AB_25]|nr:MAG: hypothetical protein ThorAB25_26210 [Candidatus Thorarchaeota archaeon AB_25]
MTENRENLAILALLLLLSFPQIFPIQQIGPTSVMVLLSSEASAGETISITSDSDFAIVAASLGLPGNGTSGNPYIIADLDIDYIRIEDTTVYFEIRRCYLAPTTDPRSIDFDNVAHGLVDSCVIEDRPNGIKARSSLDIVITNNTLRELSVESISVDYSSDCTILDNDISDGGFGVGCYDSDHVIIDRNLVVECRDGIYLPFPQYTNVTNNRVTNCSTGLTVSGGSYLHVENNTFVNAGIHLNQLDLTKTFINNTINGLELGVFASVQNQTLDGNQYGQLLLYNCENFSIVNGTFSLLSHCIELTACQNVTLENVTFDNSVHGVWMSESTGCTIKNATFRECSGWPIYADETDYLSILNSTIESDGDPILVLESVNCTIVGNTFTNSHISFSLGVVDRFSYETYLIDHYIHNIRDNTIDNLLLGYFVNETDLSVNPSEYGQMIFVNCTDIGLSQSSTSNRTIQINVFYSQDVNISNCTVQSVGLSTITFIESPNCSLIDCQLEVTNLIIDESERFTILRNTISTEYGTFIFGVNMEDSDNSIVAENSLLGPHIEGLTIYTSSNVTVSDNDLDRVYFGLIFEGSDSMIADNRIGGSSATGLTLVRSSSCTVENNTCQGSYYAGLVAADSTNCMISNNLVLGNQRDGLRLSDLTDCVVDSNKLEQNLDDGLYIDDCINCTILSNDILNNRDYGVRVHTSSNNTFYLNRIGWNGDGNSRDDGLNNTWDDGVDTGNFWRDYTGSGVYQIPGTAGSVDRFPVYLMAEDGVHPTIFQTDDVTYEFGTTGHTIYWRASDDFPYSYEIEMNGTAIESGTWESEIFVIEIDGLDIGVYNFTLTVYDEGGLWTSDTVFVTVTPQVTPGTPEDFPLLLVIAAGSICACVIVILYWIRVKSAR